MSRSIEARKSDRLTRFLLQRLPKNFHANLSRFELLLVVFVARYLSVNELLTEYLVICQGQHSLHLLPRHMHCYFLHLE